MPPMPTIFDRDLIAARLARRRGEDDFITRLVLDDLNERLAAVTRPFAHALILGPDPGLLPIEGRSAAGDFSFVRASTLLQAPGCPRVDPDHPVLEGDDHDLIVSVLDLQVVNDVPAFLAGLRRHLAPDGLLIAAAIGGRSLTEMREAFLAADTEVTGGASPRVAPMIDVRDAGRLLQGAGLALPVADLETHTVRYSSPMALFTELRALGASNPLIDRAPRPMTRTLLLRAAELYAERHSDPDGRVRATLEILWMSGWAPHDSQQKPLKPGSAQTSLRDVLGDKARNS
ncbi:SAM-dependent methyltransferase [Pelagibacterium montanilacus]|uniref:SAM-dependent methyltransferase n=1 Tax=Pelagibacterium montanilacus TaxID=2185280 RepID=UPI000F8C37E1|nr:SAM-dependent methyltransferase [Pelagibacterium montanilacus]